jgi:hypothetical protein
MKNLFIINEEEKNRILNLHETATKRHYLPEQGNKAFDITDPYNMRGEFSLFDFTGISQGPEGDPYQYKFEGDKVYYAKKNEGTFPKWILVKNPIGVEAIKTKIFKSRNASVEVPKKKTTPVKIPKKNDVKKQEVTKYNFTPRIDKELKSIIDRKLDNSPFFIYDPLQNLLYLFDAGSFFKSPKLIDYTSVVDGADAQKDSEPMTVGDWCTVSKLSPTPTLCTNPTIKTKEACMAKGKDKHPKFDETTKNCSYDASYGVLISIAERFISKGIYSISYLSRHSRYVGSGNNTFSIKDNKGQQMSSAIHGIPDGLPERLTASADLEALLKKNISSGQVPKQYLNSIKTIAYANQSFGCIGVPAKFIENPQVQKLAKGAKLFVMGESKNSFLVQNSSEFFDKLHGDGQQCVDPIMLAQSMSDNDSDIA